MGLRMQGRGGGPKDARMGGGPKDARKGRWA